LVKHLYEIDMTKRQPPKTPLTEDQVIRKFDAFIESEGAPLSRLLEAASTAILERTLARLPDDLRTAVTASQMRILQTVCLGTIRIGELADQMRITKQAAGQLVDALESKGFVERRPDPDDRRARVIAHTDQGIALVSALIDATADVEREVAKTLGRKEMTGLKAVLDRLTPPAEPGS